MIIDPTTYQGGLTSVPGQSLSQTNTPEQVAAAQKPAAPAAAPVTPVPPVPPVPPSGALPPPSFQFGQPGSQFGFAQYMQSAIDRLNSLGPLRQDRQLLIKHLYDTPLTPQEQQQLSPEAQKALQTGDKSEIEMQLRLLNDGIAGRTNTLNSSIDFLTKGYESSVQDLQKQRDDAENTIKTFVTQYGSQAGKALTSIYGPQRVAELQRIAGIDLSGISKLPETIAERKIKPSGVSSGVTTVGGSGVVAGKKVPTAIAGDVEDVLSGRNTLYNIRQTMGRSNEAASYMKSLRDSIRSIDPNFDFVASDAGGKFASSEFYNKAITAITSVEPNIDKAVALSDQVNRIGVASVDNLLQKAQVQIGNVKVANFRQAQKLIADEIGLALGQGTVSDMKLQLGFDVTDPSVSPEVFASNMSLVKEFIENRKKALEGQRYSSSTTKSSTPSSAGGSYQDYLNAIK